MSWKEETKTHWALLCASSGHRFTEISLVKSGVQPQHRRGETGAPGSEGTDSTTQLVGGEARPTPV